MDEYISWIQLTLTGVIIAAFGFFIRGLVNDLKRKFEEKFTDYKKYNKERLDDTKTGIDQEIGHMTKSIDIAHERIGEAAKAREKIKDTVFSEKEHNLVCDKRLTDIKMHTSLEVKRLGDSLLVALGKMNTELQAMKICFGKLDGRTHFLKDKDII